MLYQSARVLVILKYIEIKTFNSSNPKHLQDICLQIVSLSIDADQFFNAQNYLAKITDVTDPVMLTQLRCYSALLSLHDKQYRSAALKFLEISGDVLPSVMSLQDVALYASLLALATLDRSDIRSLVMDRKHFLHSVLSTTPAARSMVLDFFDGRYGGCLAHLDALGPLLSQDLYLSRHSSALVLMVRDRVIQQYCLPYSIICMARLASCLNWDMRRLEEVVADLIRRDVVKGGLRIDMDKQLLVRSNTSSVSVVDKVVRSSVRLSLQTGRDLLRLSMFEQDVVVEAGGTRGSDQDDNEWTAGYHAASD